MNYGILKTIERDVAKECNSAVRAYLRIGNRIIINDADEGDVPLAEDFYDSILRGERSSFCGSEIRHRNGFFCIDIVYVKGCVTLAADPLYEVLFAYYAESADELYFRDMLDHIEMLCVYPKEPRLAAYSAENAVDAMNICITPMQTLHACDVKSALCYAYANGFESFVLTDGTRCMGIAVISAKDGRGKIEYAAVERKHQLKGYGRILIEKCMDILTERGCKEAFISVHEGNARAAHVYKKTGFVTTEHENDTYLMRCVLK